MSSDHGMRSGGWKERLAVWAWELLGLVLVVAVGGLALASLGAMVAREKATLDAEKARAAEERAVAVPPVIVQVVRPETVEDAISLPGQIQAIQSVTVSTQVKGRVTSVAVEEGHDVKRGQVLCTIDDRDYRIALDDAEAGLRLARQTLDKTKRLVERKIESESVLDRDRAAHEAARARVAAARLAVERCTIASPIDGVVEDVLPEPGEFVASEKAVAVVLDLSRVKVEVGIPEQDVDAVRNLRRCSLVVDALDRLALEGTVTFLSHRPAEKTLVYLLRMEVANADRRLRPGMFVDARIVKARREGAVKVPLFSVLARRESHFVYVVQDDDGAPIVRERAVRLGVMQGRMVEIAEGLAPGDRVVVVGQRAVADGVTVQVMKTVRSMAELLR